MTNRTFDSQKAVFLERILRAWEKNPDDTFGELLYNASDFAGREINAFNDDDLCEAVERFVLLGTITLEDPITDTRLKPKE